MPALLSLLDIFAAALAALLLRRVLFRRRAYTLPPGPPGLPVIGNVLDMPSSHGWKTFAKWGEKFGKYAAPAPIARS